MILGKIDLKKIDQSKCFKGKNGAVYLDFAMMENRDGEDQYGNSHMIVQSVSKEEREAGNRGAILGNAKTIGNRPKPPQNRTERPQGATKATPTEDSSIPF